MCIDFLYIYLDFLSRLSNNDKIQERDRWLKKSETILDFLSKTTQSL